MSMCLLKINHWPNLKKLVKVIRIFSCLSYLMETHRIKLNWKRKMKMPTFEKVKEEIKNYRRGILLLKLGKLTGKM